PGFATVEPIEHRTDLVLCLVADVMARRAFLELKLAGGEVLRPAQTHRREQCNRCGQKRPHHLLGSFASGQRFIMQRSSWLLMRSVRMRSEGFMQPCIVSSEMAREPGIKPLRQPAAGDVLFQ